MTGSPASWTTTETFYPGSPVTNTYMRELEYVGNGDWLAAGYDQGTLSVFHTTDPRSTSWGTVATFSYPTVYNVFRDIVYTGSEYAYLSLIRESGAQVPHVGYASSPTGTWGTVTIGTVVADNGGGQTLNYVDGYYVIGGSREVTASNQRARIWYSTSPTGTWTGVDVTSNTTGLCNAGKVCYEDGYFYAEVANTSNVVELYRASSLSGPWSSYYTFTGYTKVLSYPSFKKHGTGPWVITLDEAGTADQCIAYADTLDAASWTVYNIEDDISTFTGVDTDVAYAGGYWVIVGEAPSGSVGVAYSTAIGGPYTQGAAGAGYAQAIAYGDLEFMILTRYGVKCMTGGALPPPPPVAPTYTYLRQRQSPVRTPSRVRGVNLRQRQTPFIT